MAEVDRDAQEFPDGLSRIRSAIDAAAATGKDLVIVTAVRLHATVGYVE
jgi:hypothetical protein